MSFATDSRNEKEQAALNQYWYSQRTIDVLCKEIQLRATKAAFLSCPSLYFSLTDEALRRASKLFEFDRRWEADPGFVFYDFNRPDLIPVSCWEQFDYVVVDPPFITKEVWTRYAEAVKLVLAKGGKVLFTSVIENHGMLEEAMGDDCPLLIPRFRPSIPHLTYQYHCFVNYPAESLEFENPELPPEDPQTIAARRMCNDMRESQSAFKAQMVSRDRSNDVAIPTLPAQAENSEVSSSSGTCMKWTRVPEGLTEYANGASAPPQDSNTSADFGPEYAALARRRQEMDQFKKLIDGAMKACDGILKLTPGSKPKNLSPDALEKERSALVEQKGRMMSEMTAIKDSLAEADVLDRSDLCVLMAECVEELSRAHLLTVDQYRELSADCTRKYKSKIFNRQKDLLQSMKAAKKVASDIAPPQSSGKPLEN